MILQPAVPFGGMKQSGWGRELGPAGLDNYLTTKAVHHYYGGAIDWPMVL
jgi:aldehyde dehydrogenase (NAD+)